MREDNHRDEIKRIKVESITNKKVVALTNWREIVAFCLIKLSVVQFLL